LTPLFSVPKFIVIFQERNTLDVKHNNSTNIKAEQKDEKLKHYKRPYKRMAMYTREENNWGCS